MTRDEKAMLQRIADGKPPTGRSKTLDRLELWGWVVAWPGEPMRLTKQGAEMLANEKKGKV